MDKPKKTFVLRFKEISYKPDGMCGPDRQLAALITIDDEPYELLMRQGDSLNLVVPLALV